MLGRGKIRAKARLALKAVKTSSEESGITATVAMPAPACIIVQVRRDLLLRRRHSEVVIGADNNNVLGLCLGYCLSGGGSCVFHVNEIPAKCADAAEAIDKYSPSLVSHAPPSLLVRRVTSKRFDSSSDVSNGMAATTS